MQIRKAVVTAAAPDQGTLPLQQLVDRTGINKSALQLILEEAIAAGIEEIGVVIRPGDADAYRSAAGSHASRLTFIEQDHPRGYGDALLRADDFCAGEPFLHLVGDHLYLSNTEQNCATQLVELARAESCAVSAVQATRESQLPFFGTVGGSRVAQRSNLYEVHRVLEKPTPTQAEQELVVAGLRSGFYLCMFGMHVLTPRVMDLLKKLLTEHHDQTTIQLSPALAELARQERYLAMELDGTRYNIGVQYGLLMAQLAIALTGADREQILTELVELLATSK